MLTKDLKVGIEYAYGSRRTNYPDRIRITSLDHEFTYETRSFGRRGETVTQRGAAAVRLDQGPDAEPFPVKPVRVLRTWAEHEEIVRQREARLQRESLALQQRERIDDATRAAVGALVGTATRLNWSRDYGQVSLSQEDVVKVIEAALRNPEDAERTLATIANARKVA